MSYSKLLAVDFGKTGLSPSYWLQNADWTNNGLEITAGIVEKGTTGIYQTSTLAVIPDGFVGGVLWNSKEVSPIYVYESINPGVDEYTDAKITSRPTATTINTTLETSHGEGSWQQSLGGIGANTVTITLTETGGTPKIPSASVEVKNSAGDTLLATSLTDSNGIATFSLDNGTYKVYNSKLGSYSFVNPQTLVVSGTTNQSYIGTPISVSAPAQANTCRMFIWAKNPDTTLMTTLVGDVTIIALPYEYSGAFYKNTTISFIKHNDGYWYVDIVYGATIIIDIVSLGIKIKTVVPSQTTKDISELNL